MENKWSMPTLISVAGLILFAILTLGGILDKKGWAFKWEVVRLIVQAASALLAMRLQQHFVLLAVANLSLASGFISWLLRYRPLFREDRTIAAEA